MLEHGTENSLNIYGNILLKTIPTIGAYDPYSVSKVSVMVFAQKLI